MKVLLGIVAGVTALLVGLSYAGAFHPIGDSFAVFRVPLAMICSLACLWARWPNVMKGGVALSGVVIIGAVFAPRLSANVATDYDVVLYQQNLLFARQNDADWLAEVTATNPDVLTLQEVSGRNKTMLDQLAATYPTQIHCPFSAVGGVSVLTRFPAIEGTATCIGDRGVAAVQLDTPHGAVWAVSVHLHWPWPFGQAEQVDRLLPQLATLDGHVMIGGDFNAVAWSHSVARIAEATQTRVVGPHHTTYHAWGYPLGIDHVLTGPAYAQEVRVKPRHGSDHNGVVAYLTRPRGG